MKKSHKDEGGSWMDTYGDMVTLLLCFFVLLYAISAVDQNKWQNLVESLNPNATSSAEGQANTNDKDNPLQDVVVPEDFESLYISLKQEVEKNNLSDMIDVKKGDGYTFISFKSNICFDANSYVLRNEVKMILDSFCQILTNYSEDVGQIQILGHTAEASPGHQINVVNDRFLSSNRATSVLIYIQEKNIFDPAKLIAIGYGQYRPIADNNTPEGRASNRRVEILITKSDAVVRSLDDYYKEVY